MSNKVPSHKALKCKKCGHFAFNIYKEAGSRNVFVVKCPFCRSYYSFNELVEA